MASPSRYGPFGAARREGSEDRALSNARLAASPSRSVRDTGIRSADTARDNLDETSLLPWSLPEGSYPKKDQAQSAIATALHARSGSNPPRPNQPPPPLAQLPPDQRQVRGSYGSFREGQEGRNSAYGSPRPFEDFDIVRRHLVGPSNATSQYDGTPELGVSARSGGLADGAPHSRDTSEARPSETDEFSSLRLLGGDITREIYKRTEAESSQKRTEPQRSQSLYVPRAEPEDESLDYDNIHQPGGFRRDHLRRRAPSPRPTHHRQASLRKDAAPQQSSFATRNFFEFLSLYGHFAGKAALPP